MGIYVEGKEQIGVITVGNGCSFLQGYVCIVFSGKDYVETAIISQVFGKFLSKMLKRCPFLLFRCRWHQGLCRHGPGL